MCQRTCQYTRRGLRRRQQVSNVNAGFNVFSSSALQKFCEDKGQSAGEITGFNTLSGSCDVAAYFTTGASVASVVFLCVGFHPMLFYLFHAFAVISWVWL